MGLPRGTRCVLLDIEGTTTPLSFVHETLFPYARRRLDESCARAAEDPRIAEAVRRLRDEHGHDPASPAFGNGAPYAAHLMQLDRKSTGLKSLQGLIWEEGYRSGTLRAPVYDDVPHALSAWHALGVRARIYSSGSVLAQRLLFAHTDHGDLTPYLEAYHDTTTGAKQEAASYRTIARDAGLDPAALLFLSDTVAELDAAAAAGLVTGLVQRPGNRPAEPGLHATYRDFGPLAC